MKKAVVLLSGGMDSATVLTMAVAQGFDCHALSVDYGQRHHTELAAAQRVAQDLGAREHRVVNIDLTRFGGSSLTDKRIAVSQQPSVGIPLTYVPARNTIMLSLALAWAEVLQARDIFIGVNAVDYSGYPDCRPAFIEAFERVANLATKAAVEGHPLRVHAPLQHMTKGEIIRQGVALGVDFSRTVSCYQADESGRACGVCDACRLRRAGFVAAGIEDTTRYCDL
jgi:7-cyano-7-deazaguanine synthase